MKTKKKTSHPRTKIPLYQRVLRGVLYCLAGILALGTFLDAISNVTSLITPNLAYIASSIVLLTWIATEIFLINRPIHWIDNDGQDVILRNLGIKARLALVGAIFFLWFPIIVEKLNNNEANIVILSPQDKESVQREIKVNGEYKKLPKDEEMWLYVYPMDECKYYLTPIFYRSDNGFWEVEPVIIGTVGNERGNIFMPGVLLTSAKVSDEIRRNQYGLEHGFDALPQGTMFNKITVNRR